MPSTMDSIDSIREALKQMILLEGHLFSPDRRCPECITKHFLASEGLLEEALSLGDFGNREALEGLVRAVRGLHGRFTKGCPEDVIGDGLRKLRKWILQWYLSIGCRRQAARKIQAIDLSLRWAMAQKRGSVRGHRMGNSCRHRVRKRSSCDERLRD